MTYTACPLGKLTRIAKTNVLTLQRYELFRYLPNKSRFILSFFSKSSFVSKIFRQALCQNRSRQQHRVKLSALESEGNQAARSNCSSSHRCHRYAHRGSTWFLLSRCKDTNYSVTFQTNLDLFYLFPQNLP